jgi:enoyl-[acyl-carrier-protein] reductase (NADH)
MNRPPFHIFVDAGMGVGIQMAFRDHSLKSGANKDAFFENLGQRIPIPRVGTHENIAKTELYLASDLSECVNGENIMCDLRGKI